MLRRKILEMEAEAEAERLDEQRYLSGSLASRTRLCTRSTPISARRAPGFSRHVPIAERVMAM